MYTDETTFEWDYPNKDETFTYHFSLSEDFKDEFTYTTNKLEVNDFGIFIPGKTYYYKVVGSESGESIVDSFKTKNFPVRYISADLVTNVRDLGGWDTIDGKKVKYGLLYRGGALDGTPDILETDRNRRENSYLTEYGKTIFNDYLNIVNIYIYLT